MPARYRQLFQGPTVDDARAIAARRGPARPTRVCAGCLGGARASSACRTTASGSYVGTVSDALETSNRRRSTPGAPGAEVVDLFWRRDERTASAVVESDLARVADLLGRLMTRRGSMGGGLSRGIAPSLDSRPRSFEESRRRPATLSVDDRGPAARRSATRRPSTTLPRTNVGSSLRASARPGGAAHRPLGARRQPRPRGPGRTARTRARSACRSTARRARSPTYARTDAAVVSAPRHALRDRPCAAVAVSARRRRSATPAPDDAAWRATRVGAAEPRPVRGQRRVARRRALEALAIGGGVRWPPAHGNRRRARRLLAATLWK